MSLWVVVALFIRRATQKVFKPISSEFLYKYLCKYVTEVKGVFTVFAREQIGNVDKKNWNENQNKDSTTITLKIKRRKIVSLKNEFTAWQLTNKCNNNG